MGAVVGFNYAAWITMFPEFQYVTSPMADAYFAMATTAHRNDGAGPVADAAKQLQLLNIVTAHIAALFAPTCPGGQPANAMVGRISDATEGSVSASADYGTVTNSEAWWAQTRYGSMYWTFTKVYRLAAYMPVPTRVFNRFGF